MFCVFSFFFFFFLRVNSKIIWFYCAGDMILLCRRQKTQFMHYSWVHILFTHLKIILLQCFQFSVFSFNNNKFNPNGPYISHLFFSDDLIMFAKVDEETCEAISEVLRIFVYSGCNCTNSNIPLYIKEMWCFSLLILCGIDLHILAAFKNTC